MEKAEKPTMTANHSKEQKKQVENRENTILDAALTAFATKGFLKTTISDITARSDVPEASIYDCFNNKQDILFSLAVRLFRALKENLTVHFLGVEGEVNRFRKFVWHHLYFFQEHPDYGRVFVLELLYNPRFMASDAYQAVHEYREVLRQIVIKGVEDGCFGRYIDAELAEIMVFGAMNHTMLSKMVLNKPLDFIDQAAGLCDLFLQAIDAGGYPVKETITGERGKRKDILAAALDAFSKNSFHQTTVSRIAKDAGVTEPTIYEHFKNKEELLYAIPMAASGPGSMLDKVNTDFQAMDTPVNRLRSLLVHHIRSIRNYSSYYVLLTTELRKHLGFYQSSHYSIIREYSALFTGIISEGIKKEAFRENVRLMLIRDLFYGMLDELIVTLHVRGELPRIVQFSETLFDLVYHAIRHPGSLNPGFINPGFINPNSPP